jgi:hypothetical protein
MIDHAARISAQQHQAADRAEIEAMSEMAAPLTWLVYLAAFVAVYAIAIDGWQHYKTLTAEHAALVRCLNGEAIKAGGAILRCEITEHVLVPGIGQQRLAAR